MVRVDAKATVNDAGWREVQKLLRELSNGEAHVKVGVLGGPKKERGPGEPVDNVDLALIHEFGAPAVGIPERSFLRSTFNEGKTSYISMLRTLLGRVLDERRARKKAGLRMTLRKALDIVGLKMAIDSKKKITEGEGIPPPLKPATVARKGSSRPLVDTGRLLNSITHAVVVGKRSAK